MERRLKYAGYEVAAYASAQHLLDRLPSDSVPGCILLDVRIPGLSGPELQARLSELGSTLPIIFLTGYPDIRTTVRTIKAGAEDFLTKPVPSDQLLHAVERAIAHHNSTYAPEERAGSRSLSSRNIDAARAASLRTCRSRQHQQADRPRIGLYRTHHQGPSPQGDGENAGPILGGTGFRCRTSWRLGQRVRQPTDGLVLHRFECLLSYGTIVSGTRHNIRLDHHRIASDYYRCLRDLLRSRPS